MAKPGYVEPMPIMAALNELWLTIVAGGKARDALWMTPKGGYVEVRWLSQKGTYRFTLDLMPSALARPEQYGGEDDGRGEPS